MRVKGVNWKSLVKLLSLLTICAVFVVVACSEIEPQTAEPVPEPAEGSPIPGVEEPEEGEEKPELRTAEVFNLEDNKDKLSVRYFYMEGDVKTGDAILITTPDGKTMMIDAGTREGGPQVLKHLNDMGIDRIDVVLNTHPHIDHLGGFPSIIRNKEIGEAYMINHPYTQSGAYNDFMNALATKKVKPVYLEEGDSFELGEHVTVEVYRPLKGELPDAIESYEARAINQFSMVFKLIYEDTSFLFAGDIYVEKEKEIVENIPELIDADMMHAPHHGSETSSSSEYVSTVSPKVVVMSSNIFTSLSLLRRYEYYGATPYSTALHGNILITSDGKELQVVTEKDWVNPLKPE